MGVFKKIAKGFLIGVGSVLSLVAPRVGSGLIVAGKNIDTGKTSDKVAAYGSNIAEALNIVEGMEAGANKPNLTIGTETVINFIKNNFLIIIIAFAALFILPKLIGGRRR